MDIQRIMNIVNQVKNIPFLQDEKIKSGDFSDLNEMGILHYVIFPFLGALGYEIYNPSEVKVEGLNKVDVFASGNNILSFNININNTNFDSVDSQSQKLFINTNGIRYVVYGDNEKILDFDIRALDKENLNLIFGLLLRENIFKGLNNSKFISEKIIETNSGNLKETKYFDVALRDLLSNPNAKFLDSLSERLFELYCESINQAEFNLKIQDEFNQYDFLNHLLINKDSSIASTGSSVDKDSSNPNVYDSYLTLPGDSEEEDNKLSLEEDDDLNYLLNKG